MAINREWKACRLGNFIKIKHGYAFKGTGITTQPTKHILVTPGNFNIGGGFKTTKFKYFNGSYPKEYILGSGVIVVTMTDLSKEGDTLGYAAKIPNIKDKLLLHNQRIGLVHFLSNTVYPEFIYWLMRSKNYQGFIVGSASGTSIRHTSPKNIQEYAFYLPPLPEQKAIADVLSSLDDKIDLLHRQNQTLENLAETLFRHYFIDNAEDDWEEKKLGDFFEVKTGKKNSNFGTKDGIYPFFTCSQKSILAPSYSFDGNAILLAGNGDFNVKRYSGKFEAYQRTYVLMPQNKKYFGYLYTFMRFFLTQITGGHQGSVIKFITKSMIEDFPVLFPKHQSDYINQLMKYLNAIFNKTDLNSKQISTLEQLRDTLLPKLISGEIRIKY